MRPYVEGEDLSGVNISEHDKNNIKAGDMIACDPDNPSDMWLVNQEYFKKTFEPEPINTIAVV